MQFHLERGAADYVAEHRVTESVVEELPCTGGNKGTHIFRLERIRSKRLGLVGNRVFQLLGIVKQSHALIGELAGKILTESVIALWQVETTVTHGDTIETFDIQLMPGQGEEIHISEHGMERLSLAKTAHIVEARIERQPLTLVALHAATRLHALFEHKHMLAFPGKDVGALKAAQTSTNNDNVVFHLSLFF